MWQSVLDGLKTFSDIVDNSASEVDSLNDISNTQDPIKVVEVNGHDYISCKLLRNHECLKLYQIRKNGAACFDIIMQKDQNSPFKNDFRLYQSDVEDKSYVLFCELKDKLPLMAECVPNIRKKTDMLQRVSQLIKAKPSWTPAHIAAYLGYTECFKNKVIQSQVNVRCEDSKQTPLHVAVKVHQWDSIVSLIELDVLIDAADSNGETALHLASYKTKDISQLIEALLEHRCNVNAQNLNGDTALHILVKHNQLSSAVMLLTHGADANIQNSDGNTPLHLAVMNGNISLVHTFIAFGVDPDIINNKGELPRHIASKEKKEDILFALHVIGANRCSIPMYSCNDGCRTNGHFNGIPPENCLFSKSTKTVFEEILSSKHFNTNFQRAYSSLNQTCSKTDTSQSYRVLSLDGGGIRGLVLIQMLDELEKILGKPIANFFDFIAGTSTGGILALVLATGKPIKECRCLYFRLKDKVFVGGRPYDANLLETFLKNELGESSVMGDIKKHKVMITATRGNRKPADLHIFRNYESPLELLGSVERDFLTDEVLPNSKEQLMWQAARATGAAPTYFRAFVPYIDGGLISNNPTLDALTEIHQCNKALKATGQGNKICNVKVVVSLGTGKPPLVPLETIDVYRPSSFWEAPSLVSGVTNLVDLLIDQATQTDGQVTVRAQAFCDMLDIEYFRLNPQLSEDIALDATDTKTLVKMLWETTAYMRSMKHELQKLKIFLSP